MSLIIAECRDLAAAEEAAQLDLAIGPADLGDDRCCRLRNESELKSSTMICPNGPVAAFSCYEDPSVVDDAHAVRR